LDLHELVEKIIIVYLFTQNKEQLNGVEIMIRKKTSKYLFGDIQNMGKLNLRIVVMPVQD
jgi:hypothetical protein